MEIDKKALDNFIQSWSDKGDEVADKVTYWNTLLRILGVSQTDLDSASYIEFEKKINLKQTKFHGFVDGYIPSTKVLIEQKSYGVDLGKAEIRPNGGDKTPITPLEQAKRYDDFLPQNEKARFYVLSNFAEIWIYDRRTNLDAEPIKLTLTDLKQHIHILDFLVKQDSAKEEQLRVEKEVSVEAGELVSKIYNEVETLFANTKLDEETINKSINMLCVRLVFCLYAEDAGLFEEEALYDYLEPIEPSKMGKALRDLFKILDTNKEDRLLEDPFFETDNPELARFPYVNGGLFSGDDIIIPPFTQDLKDLLLDKASKGFNWSNISPTIFGAIFESTLNPETRRQGGMHYTSLENIHKVIDPLFLDDLKQELTEIKTKYSQTKRLTKRQQEALEKDVDAFQDKLSKLTFFDPACGSGNFLTETYLSLRELENEAVYLKTNGQIMLETGISAKYIKVSIQQFYGIEINDFAVSVAKTALWIAEDKMMKKTQSLISGAKWDFLPLKTYTHIHEGNALRIDWDKVINDDPTQPNIKVTYIIGNPPFIGASKMSVEQKKEAIDIFGKRPRTRSIDYVGAWYYKAAEYIQNTRTECAFVSTNSITQGEQVAPLWSVLLNKYNIHINFAYRTFIWTSEAKNTANVYCVIIGFSTVAKEDKFIFVNDKKVLAKNINSYLIDAPDILIENHSKPISNGVLRLTAGNKPSDGGNLLLSKEERDQLIQKNPALDSIIKPYLTARDFLHNVHDRYCLWLRDVSPSVYSNNSFIRNRLELVKEFREKSSAKPTRAKAEVPYLFFSAPQTEDNYLCIPEISSDRRKYIPIGFLDNKTIASNKLLIVPNAQLYDFGILSSIVHMAWVKTIAGRLGVDFQYSGSIVYNTFPWPEISDEQKQEISNTAQKILDVREKYTDRSLAEMYDPLFMPVDLIKACKDNDNAVMKAYNFDTKLNEDQILAKLFELYKKQTENN